MKYCIAIFSILLLISCNSKESEIQKRSFNVLKSLDTISYNAYLNTYLLLDDYKALATKNNISKSYKDEILSVTTYQWSNFRENEYENFKEQARENKIIWKDIQFIDFRYEKNVSFGLDCLDGSIFFQHKETIYEARIYTIFDGNKYQIFGLKM